MLCLSELRLFWEIKPLWSGPKLASCFQRRPCPHQGAAQRAGDGPQGAHGPSPHCHPTYFV